MGTTDKLNKELSEVKQKLSDIDKEFLRRGILTYENALHYRGYLIYNTGTRYSYVHKEYDGAPDAYDSRLGLAGTIQQCVIEINRQLEDADS